MKYIIAICGESGSGKDLLAHRFCDFVYEANYIVSHTTRPMRENERDGHDYHFVTDEEFLQKIMDGDMLEASVFRDWHYGTSKAALADGLNVGVFNPEGLDALLQSEKFMPDIKVFCYYLDVPPKTRLLRQLMREENPDCDEIVRRYSADKIDFEDILSYPVVSLKNETMADLFDNMLTILIDFQRDTQFIDEVSFANAQDRVLLAKETVQKR